MNSSMLSVTELWDGTVRIGKPTHVVIFDLEFTAWEGSMESRWTRPGELTEVVQIGAVKLDAASLKEVDAFEMLVKPRVNPILSDYLVALTGIDNKQLAARGSISSRPIAPSSISRPRAMPGRMGATI